MYLIFHFFTLSTIRSQKLIFFYCHWSNIYSHGCKHLLQRSQKINISTPQSTTIKCHTVTVQDFCSFPHLNIFEIWLMDLSSVWRLRTNFPIFCFGLSESLVLTSVVGWEGKRGKRWSGRRPWAVHTAKYNMKSNFRIYIHSYLY